MPHFVEIKEAWRPRGEAEKLTNQLQTYDISPKNPWDVGRGVKNPPCFEAPSIVSLGGSGVSIVGGKIVRVGDLQVSKKNRLLKLNSQAPISERVLIVDTLNSKVSKQKHKQKTKSHIQFLSKTALIVSGIFW